MLEKKGVFCVGQVCLKKFVFFFCMCQVCLKRNIFFLRVSGITATSFFLPHQNLAKSHHLFSGAKDSKPLKYINTDIREQNIYDYD